MVAVAYERWSFTKGYNCIDFAGKILVFWIGSRLREVVSHGGSTVFKIFLSPRWVRRRGMRQFGERVSMKLSDSHQNGHRKILTVNRKS